MLAMSKECSETTRSVTPIQEQIREKIPAIELRISLLLKMLLNAF